MSIIIPCYNTKRWVGESIESCLGQSYRPVEVIVVDDGSTDGGPEIIAAYTQRFPDVVRSCRQSNQGAPAARNRGASLARGAALLFLDADDLLRPTAIATLLALLTDEVDIAYGNAEWVDANGRSLARKNQRPPSVDCVVSVLLNNPITSSVLFRRRVLEVCQWDTSYPCQQDYAFHAACAVREFSFQFTPWMVAAIRQHDSPSRITNRTYRSAIALESWLRVITHAENKLAAHGRLTLERQGAIQCCLVRISVTFWQIGSTARARSVFRSVNKRIARRSAILRPLSYYGIATVLGLRASGLLWRCRQVARRIVALPALLLPHHQARG